MHCVKYFPKQTRRRPQNLPRWVKRTEYKNQEAANRLLGALLAGGAALVASLLIPGLAALALATITTLWVLQKAKPQPKGHNRKTK
jgi:hypothetical protein